MIDDDRLIAAPPQGGEDALDRAIRPATLSDYVGQPAVREQMQIFISAARGRGEALDHVLIFGPPGLGKTTLSHIIANELGVNFGGGLKVKVKKHFGLRIDIRNHLTRKPNFLDLSDVSGRLNRMEYSVGLVFRL